MNSKKRKKVCTLLLSAFFVKSKQIQRFC